MTPWVGLSLATPYLLVLMIQFCHARDQSVFRASFPGLMLQWLRNLSRSISI